MNPMLAELTTERRIIELPGAKTFPSPLPAGSNIQHLAFVSELGTHQEVVLEFPPPIHRYAVLVKGSHQNAAAPDLLILSVPLMQSEGLSDADDEALTKMKHWVDAAVPADKQPSHLMTFQGAQLCWTPGRVAILAAPERLEGLRKALIEVAFYEAELRSIEQTLGEAWPQLEIDTPLAFEFEERSVSQRKQLRKRFQQILLIRARLARLGPHVHCPFLHPPTLASQISERFRDRTRMVHRHEFLGEQLEVFERVYEMCGQRASDFMLTRTGNMLEWVIIALLVTQVLFSAFELLTSMGK
jgi:hypothetical protein